MEVWRLASRNLSFEQPRIMGILNLTPDSFSDGGQFVAPDKAYVQAERLVKDGADILDLGAESTRPGAQPISAQIQLQRMLPVLEKIKNLGVPISIDTTNAQVAEACLAAGAEIINDVSGLRDSAGEVARVAARYQAGLILMHRRGDAATMQKLAVYEDLMTEVCEELGQSVERALECGLAREALVIDPGLGFSKNAEQNLFILKEIHTFKKLNLPVLLGPSRKQFIGSVTGRDVNERDFGTAACIANAYEKRIRFFRVHNVAAARDALKMLEAIGSANFQPNARLGCL